MRDPSLKEVSEKLEYANMAAQVQGDVPSTGQTPLLNRLHRRCQELEVELWRVRNSIQYVEKNAAIVDAVEIVLASREKGDPRPIGF